MRLSTVIRLVALSATITVTAQTSSIEEKRSPWLFSGGYGSEYGIVGVSVRYELSYGRYHHIQPSLGIGPNLWALILSGKGIEPAGAIGISHGYGDRHRLNNALFFGYIWVNYNSATVVENGVANQVKENIHGTPGITYRISYEYYFEDNEFVTIGPEVKYLWEKNYGEKVIFGGHLGAGLRF